MAIKQVIILLASFAFFQSNANPAPPSKSEVAPTLVCPKGFVKEGKECIKTIIEDPIYECPDGFEPSETSSSRSSRSSRSSSSRSTRRRYSLTKSSSNGIEDRRRQGDNDSSAGRIIDCIRMVSIPPLPACDSGTFNNQMGDAAACIVEDTQDPTQTCPEDTVPVPGGNCGQRSTLPPTRTCEEGFTLVVEGEDATCQKLFTIDAEVSCPEGYFIVEGEDQCIKVVTEQPTQVCPSGTLPVNETCVGTDTQDPVEQCPPGYTREGEKCLFADIIPSEVKCEEGSNYDGVDCIKETILDASLECEEGFELTDDGMCTKKVQPTQFCEDGTLDPSTGECVISESILPDFTCPEGYVTNENNDCIKLLIEDVTRICPTDYEVINNQCVLKTVTDPIDTCPAEFELSGDLCLKPLREDKIVDCPEGYTLIGNKCQKLTIVPVTLSCPDGLIIDPNSGNCVSEDFETFTIPESSCPTGYVLETAPGSTLTICVKRSSFPAIFECEEPYKLNEATGICEDNEIIPAEFQCERPFERRRNDCIFIETAELIPRCPDDHTYDKYYNNCVQKKHNVPSPKHHRETVVVTSGKKVAAAGHGGHWGMTSHQGGEGGMSPSSYHSLGQPTSPAKFMGGGGSEHYQGGGRYTGFAW